MARVQLEIQSTSLDQAQQKLNALADTSDRVADSSERATRAMTTGAKEATAAEQQLIAAIKAEIVENLKRADGAKFISNALKSQGEAARKAIVEQLVASGALTEQEGKQVAAITDLIAKFKQLEGVAGVLDNITASTLDNIQAERDYVDALEQASALVVQLNEELANAPASDQSGIAEDLRAAELALESLIGLTADENTNAKELAATFAQVKAAIAAADAEVASANTAEEFEAANARVENAREQYRLLALDIRDVAREQQAAIQAEKDSMGELEQAAKVLSGLQAKKVVAAPGADLTQLNAELAKAKANFDAVLASTAENNVAAAYYQTLIGQAVERIDELKAAQAEANSPAEIEQLNAQLKQAEANYDGLVNGAASFAQATREENSLLTIAAAQVKKLQEAQKKATNPADLKRINAELRLAEGAYRELATLGEQAFAPAAEAGTSLRTRMREARMEVVRLIEESGRITPEVIEAAKAAAELSDQIGDVDALIDAMDPEKKFQGVVQLTSSLVGGFSAIQGAMALVGGEGEDMQKLLVKLNAVMAIRQGLNAFAGIADSLKNVKALLGITTVAQQVNTSATKADIVAKGLQAAAINVGTTAANAMTSALAALDAAILANPVGAILAAVALLTTSIYLLATAEEKAFVNAEQLLKELKKVEDIDFGDAEAAARNEKLDNANKLIRAGNTLEAQRAKIVADYQAEQDARATKLLSLEKQRLAVSEAIIPLLAEMEANGLDEKRFKDLENLQAKEAELLSATDALQRENFFAEKERDNELLQNKLDKQKEQDQKAKEASEERKRLLKEEAEFELSLREGVERSLEELAANAKKSKVDGQISELEAKAAEASRAGQLEKEKEFRDLVVELRAEADQKVIDEMQRALERKLAIIQLEDELGTPAIKAMTERQLQARADALIEEGKISLSEEALAELAVLRAQKQANADRQLLDIQTDINTKRAAATNEEFKRQSELIDLQQRFAELRLDNAEGNRDEIIRILKEQGITEVDTVRGTEEAKLLIAKEAAEKKLALLQNQVGPLTIEDSINVEGLKKTILDIQGQLENLPSPNIDWAKILGVTQEEFDQVKSKLQPLVQNALASIGEFLENSLFTDKLQAIDDYIAGLDESLSATQAAIDREAEFKAAGQANEYDAEQAKEQSLKQLREEAVKEKERIARRQMIFEQAQAAIGTVLTVVNLLKDSTLKGGVLGVAIAAAVIPTIFGLINATKNKAKGAVSLFKGTDYVKRGNNPKGIDQIPANLNEGEAVVPTKENERHRTLVKGIVHDDDTLFLKGIGEAMRTRGFTLDDLMGVMPKKVARDDGFTWEDIMREFGGSERRVQMPAEPRKLPDELYTGRKEEERSARREAAFDAMGDHLAMIEANTAGLLAFHKGKAERHFMIDPSSGDLVEVAIIGNTRSTSSKKRPK